MNFGRNIRFDGPSIAVALKDRGLAVGKSRGSISLATDPLDFQSRAVVHYNIVIENGIAVLADAMITYEDT